jgi:hypothetical protein
MPEAGQKKNTFRLEDVLLAGLLDRRSATDGVGNAVQALLTAPDLRHRVQTCMVLGVPSTTTRTL